MLWNLWGNASLQNVAGEGSKNINIAVYLSVGMHVLLFC